MSIQSTQTKVTGGSAGDGVPTFKKDGYASGSVPRFVRAAKHGKDNKVGYTGPNVAQANRT